MKKKINLALKGMAMGIAEVIPGVSGGTIAFITGIYEELIETIKSFDLALLKLLLKGQFKEVWTKINGVFLTNLMIGMASGFIVGLFVISYFLEYHKEGLWGFFFGLVLASGIYIATHIKNFNGKNFMLLLAGAVFAYIITSFTPANGSESLLAVFFSAILACSALILPGLSGSFILLLLGMYSVIIPNIKELLSSPNYDALMIALVFMLGALIGLSIFSRILSYAFHHFKSQTFAILTGLMIGSLYKIWPWRNPILMLDKENGQLIEIPDLASLAVYTNDSFKIIKETNVLPGNYFGEPEVIITITSFIIGFALIFILEQFQKKGNLTA